jgi:hypothetical protein
LIEEGIRIRTLPSSFIAGPSRRTR